MIKSVTLISNDHFSIEKVLTPSLTKAFPRGIKLYSEFIDLVKNVRVTKLVRVEAIPTNLEKLLKLIPKLPTTLGATTQDLQVLVHNILQLTAYLDPKEYTGYKIIEFLTQAIEEAISLPAIDANEDQENKELLKFQRILKIREKLLLAHYWDLNTRVETYWPLPPKPTN